MMMWNKCMLATLGYSGESGVYIGVYDGDDGVYSGDSGVYDGDDGVSEKTACIQVNGNATRLRLVKSPYFIIIKILFIFPILLSSNLHASPTSSPPKNVQFKSSQVLPNNSEHEISDFRLLNRRHLSDCSSNNPYLNINMNAISPLPDEMNINITVSGVPQPSDKYWVAMISPSHSSVENCPLNTLLYKETGDLSDLPLLCHYPVKGDGLGVLGRGVGYGLGRGVGCGLGKGGAGKGGWAGAGKGGRAGVGQGGNETQEVQYGNGQSVKSAVATFTQDDMCGNLVKSPAEDFGWHDPGYIHSTVITGLKPSTNFIYKYGSAKVGWSDDIPFRTPPAGGSDELTILAFGDMGKAPRDSAVEHYIQEVASGKVDTIFHIGDISYATGFLVEWDYFLHLITPLASKLSYMTAIGNHERDYINSGSVYITPDSGGECGVPYESYFQMPTSSKDKPWYSIEQGPVHFTVISTEHNWRPNSEQYKWMKSDMASVDRNRTPWLIFAGHRPMYTSATAAFISVDQRFVQSVEPLLIQNKVDLVLFGHVHNYERTCAIYKGKCMGKPVKDENGVDTYDNSNYKAPVQAAQDWSLKRIQSFGYSRIHATRADLSFEFVNSNTRQVEDSFRIIRK
ncbi:putative inactive purple acid phosphatase 1 [Bienertia sinuspersici]